MKLGLTEGAYETGSKPLVAQECVNLYPELLEHRGRTETALRGTLGLSSWSTVGDGPIRGMAKLDGTLYAVSGTELYSIDSTGTETLIGTIAGTGRVGMAINANSELIIVNGTATGYLYTGSLAEIADADFPGGDVVHFLDNYFIVNDPDTRTFYISAASDGSTWAALDFASKEGAPYDLVSLIPNHRDLFLFGEHTYEVWRNTGNADFTFERQEGTFQERGCGAVHSVVSLDNTVYFLGDDRIVYSILGYQPVRISNHGIERALEGYTAAQLAAATAFAYTEAGHYFYVLNIANDTWVYDATYSNQTQRSTWHKRRTGIGDGNRWRADNYIYMHGKHLVGDYESGNIWEMTGTDDNGAEIERIRTMAPVFADVKPVSISRLELALEAGVDSEVWLEVSRDGGRTWGPRKIRSTGGVGDYADRVVWRRLGRSRDWMLRFMTTDAEIVNWFEAYADFEVGQG